MKYFTETIPATLAEKLKGKGMHGIEGKDYFREPSYAEVFDFIFNNGLSCEVYGRGSGYDYVICKECNNCTRGTSKARNNYEGHNDGGCWNSWHEAANAAIEKALTLF